MGLFERLRDLVRANVHDVAAQADDPEQSLNRFIDDATEHLRDFRVEVNRVEAGRIEMVRQMNDSQTAIEEWHAKAKQAFEQGREDLARNALEQEQREKEQVEHLTAEQKSIEASLVVLKEQLQKLEERLMEAKQKRDELMRRNRMAVAQKSAAESLSGLTLDDPLSKLGRMEEQVERREAEAEASYSLMNEEFEGDLSSQLAHVKKLTSEMKVDDALERLKDELKQD
ncbi:PspA/IM30 family protein [Alicyclobacillus mengziensis]|uniref:PspA/IM30 family protein n=1 Tax=Alicyclobacillus mengziensis TaxID=2931921 RepID=A0A9X7Z796_9BACL|nr:PspA/IM30 family protein [Alicyclobacillus mengziensis]QSO48874.1 PspA/IM30 family protein [Alicyclobacillus mengziensis]